MIAGNLYSATDYVTPVPRLVNEDHAALFAAAASGHTEAVFLRRFDAVSVNAAGEIFGADGILPDWFASAQAWDERDTARFARKQERTAIDPRDLGGPFLWITDRFSHVYFHWMAGTLTRLEAASSSDCARTLLVPARLLAQPYVRATLSAFDGFELGPPVTGNGRVGPVDLVTRTAVPPNLHPDLLHRVRSRLVAHFSAEILVRRNKGRPERRIYATRRLARHRHMANEAELLPVLERHGFEVVALEELAFGEQVALMHKADVLAAPHGAGLTNAMFMREGAKLLELRQLEGPPLSFFKLAGIFGLDYRYGVCENAEPDQHHHGADVTMDPAALDRLLGELNAS